MKTKLDEVKKVVDFTIISIIGKYISISFNNETFNRTITKRELNNLKKQFTWTTDF